MQELETFIELINVINHKSTRFYDYELTHNMRINLECTDTNG